MKIVVISILLLVLLGIVCSALFMLGLWAGVDLIVEDSYALNLSHILDVCRMK